MTVLWLNDTNTAGNGDVSTIYARNLSSDRSFHEPAFVAYANANDVFGSYDYQVAVDAQGNLLIAQGEVLGVGDWITVCNVVSPSGVAYGSNSTILENLPPLLGHFAPTSSISQRAAPS